MLEFIGGYPLYQIVLIGILAICVVVQIVYYVGYGRITIHRHSDREPQGSEMPPVSVVVVVADNPDYVIEKLPLLLEQNHPEYEVVVVDDGCEENLTSMLHGMQSRYANLRFTTIKADPKIRHTRKLALTVGIKAAKYENILFTNTNAWPTSDKWLSIMARGFNGGRLIIGYTGIEQRPGLVNKLIRSSRLALSMPWLRRAIDGRAYRGIYNNIGYTRSLFFESRGFTHLRMSLGEDDLYIQKIATQRNTSVILTPLATVRQAQYGGLGWWSTEMRYRSGSFSYYPLGVRSSIFFELLTRVLVVLLTVALLICAPLLSALWIAAMLLYLVREAVMVLMVREVARRVGERRLMWAYVLYDFVAPMEEVLRWVARRLKPSVQIWN